MTDTTNNSENLIIDTIFDMGFSYALSEFLYVFIIAAFFMFCLGFVFIAYDLYWRFTAKKTKGKLYALLTKGTFKDGISNESFSSIYKYKNTQGVTIYAGDNSSSNIIGSRIPGKDVHLYFKEDDIHTIHPASSSLIIWGIILAACAIALTCAVFSINEISSVWSWLIFLPPVIAVAPKSLKIAKEINKDWKEKKNTPPAKQKSAEDIEKLMHYRAENDHYLFREDVIERLIAKDKQTKNDPYIMIAICTFAIALSTYIGYRDFHGDGYFGYGTGPEIINAFALLIIMLCLKSIRNRAKRKAHNPSNKAN